MFFPLDVAVSPIDGDLSVPGHPQVFSRRGAKLQKRIATVADILRDDGYQTHAITTIQCLRKTYGFDQRFDNLGAPGHQTRAERVTDDAIEWVSGQGNQRSFLFVHYYDPHSDSTPPGRVPGAV